MEWGVITIYAKVEDGQVIQVGLLSTGILKDGRTVSNYHLLPQNILIAEGWLPCEEIKPGYDKATQHIVIDTKEVQEDKVILTYKVIEIPNRFR